MPQVQLGLKLNLFQNHIEGPLTDTVAAGNYEPNDAVEPEIKGAAPQQNVGDMQRGETQKSSAFIEVKNILHKKKFRE